MNKRCANVNATSRFGHLTTSMHRTASLTADARKTLQPAVDPVQTRDQSRERTLNPRSTVQIQRWLRLTVLSPTATNTPVVAPPRFVDLDVEAVFRGDRRYTCLRAHRLRFPQQSGRGRRQHSRRAVEVQHLVWFRKHRGFPQHNGPRRNTSALRSRCLLLDAVDRKC